MTTMFQRHGVASSRNPVAYNRVPPPNFSGASRPTSSDHPLQRTASFDLDCLNRRQNDSPVQVPKRRSVSPTIDLGSSGSWVPGSSSGRWSPDHAAVQPRGTDAVHVDPDLVGIPLGEGFVSASVLANSLATARAYSPPSCSSPDVARLTRSDRDTVVRRVDRDGVYATHTKMTREQQEEYAEKLRTLEAKMCDDENFDPHDKFGDAITGSDIAVPLFTCETAALERRPGTPHGIGITERIVSGGEYATNAPLMCKVGATQDLVAIGRTLFVRDTQENQMVQLASAGSIDSAKDVVVNFDRAAAFDSESAPVVGVQHMWSWQMAKMSARTGECRTTAFMHWYLGPKSGYRRTLLSTALCPQTGPSPFSGLVYSCALSPREDSRKGASKNTTLYDLRSRSKQDVGEGLGAQMVAWVHGTPQIITCSTEREVAVWDVRNAQKPVKGFEGVDDASVTGLDIASYGSGVDDYEVAMAFSNGLVRTIDVGRDSYLDCSLFHPTPSAPTPASLSSTSIDFQSPRLRQSVSTLPPVTDPVSPYLGHRRRGSSGTTSGGAWFAMEEDQKSNDSDSSGNAGGGGWFATEGGSRRSTVVMREAAIKKSKVGVEWFRLEGDERKAGATRLLIHHHQSSALYMIPVHV